MLVAVGGAVGGVLRAVVREVLPASPGSWSWATLAVNALGALALTALLGVLARRPSREAGLLLGTGLLGAFTTFSGFALDAVLLAEAGRAGLSALYVVVSVVSLLAAGALGARLVRAGASGAGPR